MPGSPQTRDPKETSEEKVIEQQFSSDWSQANVSKQRIPSEIPQVNLVSLKLKDRTVVSINTHRKFGHKFTNLEASQQNRKKKPIQ